MSRALRELLARRFGHNILAMMVATRFVGSIGGSLTIIYVNLTLSLPAPISFHFDVLAAVSVVAAVMTTVLLGMWETRLLRRVLRDLDRGVPVPPDRATAAGREAVRFTARHHWHEAFLVPMVTTLPVCLILAAVDRVEVSALLHIVVATFLGISTSLLCMFFAVERWMQGIIRYLLDHGVKIPFDEVPMQRLRVRLNITFSLTILSTALMIGALANQRSLEIIRTPWLHTQIVADLQRHITYVFLAAVTIGFALATLLAQSIASRVTKIVSGMKRVQQGNLQERLQPTGNDEIDALARQFNAMVEQLEHNHKTIADLNANLERKVARRTRQLTKSRRRLKRSLKKLRQYDRLKTQFFSNVSHELRTPLTMILVPLERLIHAHAEHLPPGTAAMLQMAQLNGRRLLELINRLLDFAKLEAGQVRLQRSAIQLNRLIEKLAAAATPLAEQRGIRLLADYDPALEWIEGDEEKIDTIVGNLLSNALKFTPRGGTIRLRTRRHRDTVRVAVSDTGIGIDPSAHQRVFERFVQVDGSISREFSGTGLGLALAKELVELHGGRIHLESALGQGSTFWFELPLAPAAPPAEAPPAINTAPANTAPAINTAPTVHAAAAGEAAPAKTPTAPQARNEYRFADLVAFNPTPQMAPTPAPTTQDDSRAVVLVVDDSSEMRAMLAETLRDDYRVILANDGQEACELLRQVQPDLILSDVMMPRLDGFEFCRRVKGDPQTVHVPFVMLTARAELDGKIDGLNCGADDYLSKPFDMRELKARCRSLVKLHALHKNLEARNRDLQRAYQDLRTMQDRLVQSEKMSSLGQLVAGLAHEINNSVNAIYNGIKPLAANIRRLQEKMLPADSDQPVSPPREQTEALFKTIASLATVIENGATRTTRIISDLRTFSHPGSEAPVEFDLHEALDMCLNLLHNQLKHRVTVQRRYGDVPPVKGPYGQLNQVFMNILNNAQQAIPESGQITITTECREGMVRLSVQDNGVGIPEEYLGKIFDPFFTTKEPGVGTGLGLSLSYGILHQLGGTIECRSQPGQGAEFVVTFPCVAVRRPPSEADLPIRRSSIHEEQPDEARCVVC